jgi:glycosyltransferase involved in cell wall biosynthesis
VANSTFVADRIRRYYGRESTVVPPPVDVEFFTPSDGDDGETGASGRGRAGAPFVLMVAALSPYKRIADAVAACAGLGLRLRVVGEGPDRERLETLPGAGVELLGQVSNSALRDLYREAACLVQPGVEDFGIAAVEALACGCPVVAAGRGGVLDVVDDGVHGLLYPESEGVAGLKGCIDKAMGMHFNILNLRERASLFGRARFRERMRSVLHRVLGAGEQGS